MANTPASRAIPGRATPAPSADLLPLQFTPWSKEHFETEEGINFFNQWSQQVVNKINQTSGQSGPVQIPNGLDMQGSSLTGLPTPTNPSDAVSAGHASANYGAPALSPQLDVGGTNGLKGLAFLYNWQQTTGVALAAQLAPGDGISATIALAKITGGGTDGSITVLNGIITGFVQPT